MTASTYNSRVCPSPETVRKYLDGWTDEGSSQQIEEHLNHCEACASAMEPDRNPSDQWLQAIRSETAWSETGWSETGWSETMRNTAEATRDVKEHLYEEIDPIAVKAMELSKKLLQHESSSARPIIEKQFTHLVTALGEIGPYELIRRIGQGGMGYVMLARHKHLNKEVAVKILPSTPWRVPSEEARFQREVRAVGKLEHPSIVTALDAGEYQGTHFLAMEYVDGLDLSRLTKSLGPLSIPDACELIRQTALGLSYAHAQGIVHRDVKPSNLMLDRTGKVKILDFGLAQLQPWDDGCADLTSVGQLMGTLDYMAPEQAEHGGAVSYRADLYSLGATLFRLLVGRAPLAITPTQTPIEKLRLLSHHPIPRLKTMLPDAPDGICTIVDNLLARDPGQRPPSAAHLAELLEPWSKGSMLVALAQRGQEVALQSPESLALNPSLQTSQRLAQASSLGTKGHPKTQATRGRSRWNWILWTAAGLLAPLAAYGGFLFYLETQKGQIVVESEVAEVRVRLVSDGKEVDDLQLVQGANSIRVQAGKYELVIDSPTDSITMSNQAFVLKKGETVVARIRRAELPGEQINTSAATLASKPGTPVFDGKTLREWLAILDRERAFKQVNESLEAIDGLATQEDRDIIRKPLDAQIQRFSDNVHIVRQALSIEKKIGTDGGLESQVIAILRITPDEVLYQLLDGNLRRLLQNDRVFAESLMSLDLEGRDSKTQGLVSDSLVGLLVNPSEFSLEDLHRYCIRAIGSKNGRARLLNPARTLPVAVQPITDSLVLRILNSSESTVIEKSDSMGYLLNTERLGRVRKEAIVAIEKILTSISSDDVLRSTDTNWDPDCQNMTRSINAQDYEAMIHNPYARLPFGMFVLRFVSRTNLSAELAQPLRELAKSCLKSIQPIAPELLSLRMVSFDVGSWNTSPNVYSLSVKPLAGKKDFCTFHLALRLLQSNKLAELRDFVPALPIAIEIGIWSDIAVNMKQFDADHDGDLDKEELGNRGDFAAADNDNDGQLTDVEYYRYALETEQQRRLEVAKIDIRKLAKGIEEYKRSYGALPKTLRSLWIEPSDFPKEKDWRQSMRPMANPDPWGTPYQFTISESGFLIRSNGPDRIENTDDDLTSRE